jgi:hypothetical protein
MRGRIQKFPDWVDNEIYPHSNKHSLRSNTKSYGGKIHWTGSQSSDTTASTGRELYHLQFSLQAASPETFGYTLVEHVRYTRNAYKIIVGKSEGYHLWDLGVKGVILLKCILKEDVSNDGFLLTR